MTRTHVLILAFAFSVTSCVPRTRTHPAWEVSVQLGVTSKIDPHTSTQGVVTFKRPVIVKEIK